MWVMVSDRAWIASEFTLDSLHGIYYIGASKEHISLHSLCQISFAVALSKHRTSLLFFHEIVESSRVKSIVSPSDWDHVPSRFRTFFTNYFNDSWSPEHAKHNLALKFDAINVNYRVNDFTFALRDKKWPGRKLRISYGTNLILLTASIYSSPQLACKQ